MTLIHTKADFTGANPDKQRRDSEAADNGGQAGKQGPDSLQKVAKVAKKTQRMAFTDRLRVKACGRCRWMYAALLQKGT